MPTLLFLGASVSQVQAIRWARSAGFRTIAVDGDPAAVAFDLVDVPACVDFTDVEGVIAVARQNGVDGVLAVCSDRAVVPAAEVAEQLTLPGIGTSVARAMTDKPLMRALAEAAGVPQPRHVVVTESSGKDVFSVTGLPAVLKPADSGGQRGLYLLERRDQLSELLPRTLALSRSSRAMLEQYIEGRELNGMIVVRGGVPTLLTLSDRLRPNGPGFGVGWIHSFPSSLPRATQDQAREVAFAAVSALGLRDGIAFPQLIADDEGQVRLIEIAARIAAGQMADLVRYATGVNLYEIAVAQALGWPMTDTMLRGHLPRPIAIRFLTAQPGVLPVGTVTDIKGLEDVRATPGVLAADLYFGRGDTIEAVRVDADRKGYVIATGATAEAALKVADEASTKLQVDAVQEPATRSQTRRLTRLLPAALVSALILGSAISLAVSEDAKLQHALLTGTRVDKQFSPVCGCASDVAHIAFRLLRKAVVTVQIVNAAGRPVTTFFRHRLVPSGWEHLRWTGQSSGGTSFPDGAYEPRISFTKLGRTLTLPSPIRIDTDRPRVLRDQAIASDHRITVRYTLSEPGHAALIVDGERAVFTRSSRMSGALTWGGRLRSGRRSPLIGASLRLGAVDLAGNRSALVPIRPKLLAADLGGRLGDRPRTPAG